MIKFLLIKTIDFVPKKLVWKIAKKYISGTNISSVVKLLSKLNKEKLLITVDVLGEYITELSQAEQTKNEYLKLLVSIYKETNSNYVSIKPTAFGLLIDEEVCYNYVREVVKKANEIGGFVRIDMEDSGSTDRELKLYYRLLNEFPNNIGIVIQAYLYRSFDDIKKFVKDYPEPYKINIRLCKGIYIEPEEIAYRREEINQNYIKLLEFMLENKIQSGIATHDKELVYKSFELIEKYNIPKNKFEFQMLYGVTPKLRQEVIDKGYKMRLYIPYGKDWYGYSVRRMKENPNLALNIFKSLFIKN